MILYSDFLVSVERESKNVVNHLCVSGIQDITDHTCFHTCFLGFAFVKHSLACS